MKCAKCGAELKEGCLYCSVCGHEAQMVNGYSVLEEDYLKALLTDEASKDTSSEETENQNKKAEGHHKKKKQTPWIVLGCVAARKEYDSALVLEMEIINLDKKNKEAYQGLITIYEAKGQYDKITELASTVTDTDLLELFSGYIVAEPVFYPDEGTYDVYTEVTIFSIEECDIYYTLDESDPKKNGILYTDAGIELDDVGKYTIKAVCKNDKGIYSDVVTYKYKTEAKAPDYPEVTPDGGTMDDITFVVITADEGCSIYYTWDGTDPTDTSARYTEPIEVPEGNNILSIIVVNDKTKLTSEIYRTNFIYHAQPEVEIEE